MGKVKIDWHSKSAILYKKDSALERFKRYLVGLGLRNETVKLYVGRVGAFLDHTECDDPHIDLANDYRSSLIEQGLSKSHINNSCFAIRKYFKMNNIEWDFTVMRPDDELPYYFDEQDVLRIFSVCTNIKHSAMVKTLFFGCLRSSELCRLDDNDLNLEARTIRLRETKGHRDDFAYINAECVEILKSYLKIRPQIKIGDRMPLFYTDNLNLWAKNDIHRMFLYYKKKAGIKKPGAVHIFSRHTPATILVARGCDIRIVKELLRHKDIRTTLRYAHVSEKTKRERYEQCLVL